MSRVHLDRVSKAYAGEPAVRDLSLEVEEGEFLTLLGPSGCGKTTTLRLVAGFLTPDAGRVVIGDRDVTRVPPRLRNIGMVFQDYALFPHLTVAENVAFGLRERGVDRARAGRRVEELLGLVRLPGAGGRHPGELSGGQQQRVALARALAHTPAVLLMDEPLGALDLKLREAMQAELHAIQRQLRITTLYVTHDQEEALSLSDRIALVRGGRILQVDTPRRLYTEPGSPWAAYFLGKINFLRATVTGKGGGMSHLALAGAGPARVPLDALPPGLAETGSVVILAVRPEDLRVTREAPAAGLNAMAGSVAREKFVGSAVQVTVQVPDGPALVAEGGPAEPLPDGPVHVAWDPGATRVFPWQPDPEIGL